MAGNGRAERPKLPQGHGGGFLEAKQKRAGPPRQGESREDDLHRMPFRRRAQRARRPWAERDQGRQVTRLLALAFLFLAASATAQDKEAPKDLVLTGDAKCTRCHDENDSFPVLAIGKTKHGTLADVRTPTCTSCHGASDCHLNHKPDSGARAR